MIENQEKRNLMTLEDLKNKYPNLHVNWRRAELPDGYIDWVYEVPNTNGESFISEDGFAYDKKDLRFIDYDFIKITPRESYMIMDCLSYAIGKMDKEDIDYLYCNYSVEEIANCAQYFGKMNLKNQW